MRKIAAILVDRANYARLRPVLIELQKMPNVDLKIVCSGTMVLERFGSAAKDLKLDDIPVESSIFFEVEGSTPLTMTKSIGMAVMEFASEFNRMKPDMVLVIGDRYEALAATIAASYLNICVAHLQGGEVSGSIDESARHAITKFSQYHFPSTGRSADYLLRMGEKSDSVFMYGCPSGDQVVGQDLAITAGEINKYGVGATMDISKPYLVVMYHPITTSYGSENNDIAELFNAVASMKMQTCWLWPNIDAGSDHISKFIRSRREGGRCDSWAKFVKHFEAPVFLRVMANAACLVGNSSSFVRDSSFFGTPVVLVGERQQGREYGENLVKVAPVEKEIKSALEKQLNAGKYRPSELYGRGDAGVQIAQRLATVPLYTQKILSFVDETKGK